jgi:methionyl-tRNA formyltransferase
MRVGVAATPYAAIPTLDWLFRSSHELSFVITRPDRPAGRGRVLQESVVARWAATHDIPCIKPVASADLLDWLRETDLVITIGYGVILPAKILSVPRYGFINLHFSLLPAWRGAAPVQRSILNGDEISGVTAFALDSGMDTGPIYVQHAMPIDPYENAGELLVRMADTAPEILAETLVLIAAGAPPQVQPLVGVSYAPKVTKRDARIDWGFSSAISVHRQIRAFTPEPGTWTTWRESTLHVSRARPLSIDRELVPGTVLIENANVIVGCADGTALVLEQVTPAGKKMMSATDWANGARLVKGDSFV